jgi:hypothetical protein
LHLLCLRLALLSIHGALLHGILLHMRRGHSVLRWS